MIAQSLCTYYTYTISRTKSTVGTKLCVCQDSPIKRAKRSPTRVSNSMFFSSRTSIFFFFFSKEIIIKKNNNLVVIGRRYVDGGYDIGISGTCVV